MPRPPRYATEEERQEARRTNNHEAAQRSWARTTQASRARVTTPVRLTLPLSQITLETSLGPTPLGFALTAAHLRRPSFQTLRSQCRSLTPLEPSLLLTAYQPSSAGSSSPASAFTESIPALHQLATEVERLILLSPSTRSRTIRSRPDAEQPLSENIRQPWLDDDWRPLSEHDDNDNDNDNDGNHHRISLEEEGRNPLDDLQAPDGGLDFMAQLAKCLAEREPPQTRSDDGSQSDIDADQQDWREEPEEPSKGESSQRSDQAEDEIIAVDRVRDLLASLWSPQCHCTSKDNDGWSLGQFVAA